MKWFHIKIAYWIESINKLSWFAASKMKAMRLRILIIESMYCAKFSNLFTWIWSQKSFGIYMNRVGFGSKIQWITQSDLNCKSQKKKKNSRKLHWMKPAQDFECNTLFKLFDLFFFSLELFQQYSFDFVWPTISIHC